MKKGSVIVAEVMFISRFCSQSMMGSHMISTQTTKIYYDVKSRCCV